jgi:hypothetical protein
MSETRPAMGNDDFAMLVDRLEKHWPEVVADDELIYAICHRFIPAALPSAPRSDEGAVAYRIDLGHGFNYYDAAPGKYEKLQAQGRPIQPLYAAPPSPPPSVEVGEMVEWLQHRSTVFVERGMIDHHKKLIKAASLLIALDAERGRMREALKPFSVAAGGWFMKNYNAKETIATIRVDREPGVFEYFHITAGHLFAARAILSKLKEA